MSVLLAGGGMRGGQTYGTSDRFGAYPDKDPVQPEDITRTIYSTMGIHDLTAKDADGRTFNLMEGGRTLSALF